MESIVENLSTLLYLCNLNGIRIDDFYTLEV